MNSLDTPEGKLLYIVHEMYKAYEITAKKRGYLKDMIFSANPTLLEKYREYEAHGTELTLRNSIHRLSFQENREKDEVSSASSTSNKKVGGLIKLFIPTKKDIQYIPGRDLHIQPN